MKIAIVSKYGSVPGSGTGTRLFYVAKYLSRAGHSVEYIVSNSNHLDKGIDLELKENVQKRNDLKLKVIKLIKYKKPDSVLRFLSWIEFELKLIAHLLFKRMDVVLVSSPPIFSIFSGVLFKTLHRSKLIVDIRDIWPLSLIEEGGISKRHPLIRIMHSLQNLGYQKADLILSPIPNLSEHIKEEIGRDARFHCLPMGYDEEDDLNENAVKNSQNTFEQFQNKFVVGYVGSVGPSNNLDTFIDYISQEKSENVHFLIVGDGSCLAGYMTKLKQAQNVTFFGRLPKAEARHIVSICDLVYFSTHESSLWKYGQSLNKLLDYMLLGKTVVAAYPSFGYRTMLNEAGSGYFIEANNLAAHREIFQSLASKNKAELAATGQKGRDWVLSNRNYKHLVEKFENVLAKIHSV